MTSNIGSNIIQEKFSGMDEYNREDIIAKTSWEVNGPTQKHYTSGISQPR